MSELIKQAPYQGISTQSLARMLFKAELGEDEIRSIPAQALYLALRHIGVSTGVDIVEQASVEQCRAMLDLDLWSHDTFTEEKIWEWLALSEASSDLTQLQKFVKYVDYKIVALLIQRHVEVQTFADPTEMPPGPQFYTPDKGYTWMRVTLENADQHFLLSRLLAMIFESNADLFYQLMNIASAQTQAMLEEESLIDRNRRLSSEGIPDKESAARFCPPISEGEALQRLKQNGKLSTISEIMVVEPLIYSSQILQPLDSFIQQVGRRDEVEAELTFLMNSCIVRYGVDFSDQAEVVQLIAQVRGAINLGLQSLALRGQTQYDQIFETLGLRGLFGVGLFKLNVVRKSATTLASKFPDLSLSDQVAAHIVEAASQPIPMTSSIIETQGRLLDIGSEPLSTHLKAIEQIEELESLQLFLKSKVV